MRRPKAVSKDEDVLAVLTADVVFTAARCELHLPLALGVAFLVGGAGDVEAALARHAFAEFWRQLFLGR